MLRVGFGGDGKKTNEEEYILEKADGPRMGGGGLMGLYPLLGLTHAL